LNEPKYDLTGAPRDESNDGSKFQTVSSARGVREREALERYLEQLEQSDRQDEVIIDPGAVASALEKLRQHPEPEAGFMRTTTARNLPIKPRATRSCARRVRPWFANNYRGKIVRCTTWVNRKCAEAAR
jgi:hypothetical protein